MAGTAFGLDQIASLYDPSVAVDQAALQRQMAMAQALRQQAMAPVDTAGRQIGGMGYRISPWEGAAKIAQALMANRADTATDKSRLALNQQMAKALGIGQPEQQQTTGPQMSTPDNPQFNVPAPQGQSSGGSPLGGGIGIPQMLRQGMIENIGGSALASATAKQYEPTEFARALRSAGVDPDSAIGRKLHQDHIAKLNNMPMENVRPGGYQRNPITGEVMQYPQVPAGFQAQQGPGGFTINPVAGGPQAVQASAKAGAAGSAAAIPEPTVDASGNPQPLRSRAQVLGIDQTTGDAPQAQPNGNLAVQIPPARQAQRNDDRGKILAAELRNPGNTAADNAAIQKELSALGPPGNSGGVYAAPPLGTKQAQDALGTKWEAQQSANREAMNTSSYLDNIVQAAHKGAIVGPGADRREMIQGMLQLAGIKEEVNTNATSQTQLLNKYSNQIVTRLGASGGLGTDAARAMLASAYPGQHMNVGAIDEAVANLKGAQAMTQAKTSFLEDVGNKRDSTGYSRKEIAFDQAADPRIFQWKAMRDPAQKSAFAKQLIAQDPTVPDRIRALEKMGAW